MSGWFNAVWPVGAFFLGGLSTHTRDLLSDKRQRRREGEVRKAERQKAILDRREDFELEHLERLNNALQVLGRLVARAHLADLRQSRDTGMYASTLLEDGLSDEILAANRDVSMLSRVVLVDDLRQLVLRTQSALNAPSGMHRADPDDATRTFSEGLALLEAAQEAIATRIREIYIIALADS